MRNPRARDLAHAVRPARLGKSALIAVAPASVGALTGATMVSLVPAIIAFTLASAGVYLTNDVVNREADALHPDKRDRPVAAGRLSPRVAGAAGAALMAGGVLTGWLTQPDVGAVVAAYVLLNVAYTAGLRSTPLVDIACSAAGKGLRVLAGYAVIDARADLLMIATVVFGSAFLLAELRASEWRATRASGDGTRPTLRFYTPRRAGAVRDVAGLASVGSFGSWVLGHLDGPGHALAGLCAFAALVVSLLVIRTRPSPGRVREDAFQTYGGALSVGLAFVWLVAVSLAA